MMRRKTKAEKRTQAPAGNGGGRRAQGGDSTAANGDWVEPVLQGRGDFGAEFSADMKKLALMLALVSAEKYDRKP